MILNRLFVPSNCLQGGELPIHLLWSRDKILKIHIEIPKSFEILRINNGEDFQIQENCIINVSKFEENGFLGMILKTPQLPQPSIDETIIFEIIDSNGERQVEKRYVHLFRPLIKVISVPNQMMVKKESNQECLVNNRILINNEGEGIAVIGFKVLEDSQLKIVEPKGTEQFAKSFWSDWSLELEEIKSMYPDHATLINNLVLLGTSHPQLDASGMKKVKEVFEQLRNELMNDLVFAEDFIKSSVVAYMKNLHIITELESFVTYLKSIESNRIILDNPIGVLKIGREQKKFKAELTTVDLGYNSYPPIPIELKLSAEDDCEVPIHKILAVVQNNMVIK